MGTIRGYTSNKLTFAGHETTSGLLSFLFVFLIQNLEALKTAQEEVDRVVGQGPVTPDHMSKLPYITACLRETLRLWPTAPNPRVVPIFTDDKDYPVHIGKKRWIINKGESIIMNLPCCHLDPLVYGEDAKDFKPERMLDDKFNKLPPNAWKVCSCNTRIMNRLLIRYSHSATV